MIASMLLLAMQIAPPAPSMPTPAPTGRLRGLVSTFDMICTRVFPDDARIATAMIRVPGMRPLTSEQIRTLLKDDPGRGWIVDQGGATIMITLEFPPIHSCAVRMPRTDGAIDEAMWRTVIDAAEARAGGGFKQMPQQSFVIGGMRSTVMGDQKLNPDGSAEAFYLFRTAPVDPVQAGPYGVELRLVHQIVAPGAR